VHRVRTVLADALSKLAVRLDPTPPRSSQPFVVLERARFGWIARVHGEDQAVVGVAGGSDLGGVLVGAGLGLIRSGVRL